MIAPYRVKPKGFVNMPFNSFGEGKEQRAVIWLSSGKVGDKRVGEVVYLRSISNTSIKPLLDKTPPITVSLTGPDVFAVPVS